MDTTPTTSTSATTDPVEIMLAHDRWATRALLDACAGLNDEQLHQRFEIGPGSLHDTATHILGAMRAWGDMLAGRAPRDRLEQQRRTPEELMTLHDEIADDFAASVRAHPFDETITAERGGQSYTFTRGGVFTHVMTHGVHHRAQCLNMLRHLGREALPPSSVLQWMLMSDGAR